MLPGRKIAIGPAIITIVISRILIFCKPLSTNWARVIAQGRSSVNPIELDYYDRLVDTLLARGLKPAVTLYHWELGIGNWELGIAKCSR